ncbi:hypothetical protein [Duganella sp. BuS-21]|uniref:hypothetical protein n=1 Tax=Duganella sp. BuS-21 TaxID=2943848 RepID=UPI0035A6D6A1
MGTMGTVGKTHGRHNEVTGRNIVYLSWLKRQLSAPDPPAAARRWDSVAAYGIIQGLISALEKKKTMEAERINALTSLLADLTTREAELRRYL